MFNNILINRLSSKAVEASKRGLKFHKNDLFPRQSFRYHNGIIWVSFSVLRYQFGIAKFQSSFGHFLESILKV